MKHPAIKEGFKGQRILSFPEESIKDFFSNKMLRRLYISRIGFFPEVKYHYNSKEKGTDYCIVIYCIQGKGWLEYDQKKYEIEAYQYIILPSGIPYRYGADDANPWTIYWLHFKGENALEFVSHNMVTRRFNDVNDSRIQYRIDLFEEIYSNLESGFIRERYEYACMCLYHLLATFLYIPESRHLNVGPRNLHTQHLMEQTLHFMKEHVNERLTLEKLAGRCRLSVSQFSFLFRQYTSFSPIDYFLRLKIQRACQYLELTQLKISEISVLLGFEDMAYFTRLFTKQMKMPPSVYRQMN